MPAEGAPARAAALEALGRLGRGRFLRDELDAVFGARDLSARDRHLATQLATGAVRHRRTLRAVLQHVRGEGGAVGSIQLPLREILEVGAFELLFLDRVPAYAAVSEAAEAARRTAGGRKGEKAAGFVNGRLRGVGRLVAGRESGGAAGRDALPHPEGGVVRLRAAVLPEPEADAAAFLGAAYSYPDWLVRRWLEALGREKAEAVLVAGNRRPRTYARVSAGAAGMGLPAGPRPGSVDVSDVDSDELRAMLAEGRLTVQDPSAMAAVAALAPQAGERVLDLCASPGTKTTQIAEAMGDRGVVVACDRSEAKLAAVRAALAARGLTSVKVSLSSEVGGAAPGEGFDAALVDVPCSNTGVLARRVEVRWRLRPRDLAELARLQGELLALASEHVRPGGRLVYSTCSLEAEENGDVVTAFAASRRGWEVRRQEQILPGADHDGAYWALLGREGP